MKWGRVPFGVDLIWGTFGPIWGHFLFGAHFDLFGAHLEPILALGTHLGGRVGPIGPIGPWAWFCDHLPAAS